MKTILYIKTHNKTGLKYFGKAASHIDLQKYKGSGKYWRQHLKKHGYDVSTEIVREFDDAVACHEFATKFSIENNIVESDEWANLQIENGQDGAPVGHIGSQPSEEARKIVSEKIKQMWKNNRDKMVDAQRKSWTPERKKEESNRKVEFWTQERKQKQSMIMMGHSGDRSQTGIPKPKGFGKLISKALSGKSKSTEHLRNLSLSRQSDKRTFVDHRGERYSLHSEFTEKYGVAMNTFRDLDAKIKRHTPVYEKLGIDFNCAKNKTKRELGFRFE